MVYSPVNPWTFPVNPSFPWLPAANTITSITQARAAVVTTGTDHGYSTGFNVRITLPFPYAFQFGMIQINGLTGTITVLTSNSFEIDIDTTGFDPFVLGTTFQTATVAPIGQFDNTNLDDFQQVNPVNPTNVADVPIFQKPGLQSPGACSTN